MSAPSGRSIGLIRLEASGVQLLDVFRSYAPCNFIAMMLSASTSMPCSREGRAHIRSDVLSLQRDQFIDAEFAKPGVFHGIDVRAGLGFGLALTGGLRPGTDGFDFAVATVPGAARCWRSPKRTMPHSEAMAVSDSADS